MQRTRQRGIGAVTRSDSTRIAGTGYFRASQFMSTKSQGLKKCCLGFKLEEEPLNTELTRVPVTSIHRIRNKMKKESCKTPIETRKRKRIVLGKPSFGALKLLEN